ncbi:histidine--tRNA ligase, partial [bacterium]|nr:histidine--tRNA ligase [bacterium]
GRYNNLIAQMGGPDTSAIGFAAGIERIVLSLERSLKPYEKDNKSIYLATISPEVSSLGIKIVQELRETSFIVNMDWTDKSLKSQLRKADKLKAKFTIILGEEEKAKHKVLIRDMEDKSQEEIPIEKIKEYFIKKFYLESS